MSKTCAKTSGGIDPTSNHRLSSFVLFGLEIKATVYWVVQLTAALSAWIDRWRRIFHALFDLLIDNWLILSSNATLKNCWRCCYQRHLSDRQWSLWYIISQDGIRMARNDRVRFHYTAQIISNDFFSMLYGVHAACWAGLSAAAVNQIIILQSQCSSWIDIDRSAVVSQRSLTQLYMRVIHGIEVPRTNIENTL